MQRGGRAVCPSLNSAFRIVCNRKVASCDLQTQWMPSLFLCYYRSGGQVSSGKSSPPDPQSPKLVSPEEWGGLSSVMSRFLPNTCSWSSIISLRMSAIMSKRKSNDPGGPCQRKWKKTRTRKKKIYFNREFRKSDSCSDLQMGRCREDSLLDLWVLDNLSHPAVGKYTLRLLSQLNANTLC